MEYYPLHPGTYGISLETFKLAATRHDVSRKRPRDEDSGDAGRNNEHDVLASSSSTTVNTPENTRQRTGEPGQVKRNREAIEIPSSTSSAVSTSVSSVAPASPITDSNEAKRLERLAARQQRRLERMKQNRRASIARQVGHEVDSDGERQYWEECHARDRAEEARRMALSPEARRQEDIEWSAEVLRDHLKPRVAFHDSGLQHLYHYPLFMLQTAPNSPNGAACKLGHCTARIAPGKYRIALSPGRSNWTGPDYYHVKCFEELLDLSSPHYVARFLPDRKHTPDHGANCILGEYISRWKLRIQQLKETPQAPNRREEPRDSVAAEQGVTRNKSAEDQSSTTGTTTPQMPRPDTPTESVMQEPVPVSSNAIPTDHSALPRAATEPSSTSSAHAALDVWKIGDSIWKCERQNAVDAFHDRDEVFDILDPAWDANGKANTSADQALPWHITQYLLPENDPDYDERHALSDALAMWQDDVFVANTDIDELCQGSGFTDDDELIQEMRQRKSELGELSLEKIERYSDFQTSDYRLAFFGGK